MKEDFDLLIIGGGPGGYVCAIRAAQLGLDEEPFPGAELTLPWLDEQANLRKEKNFFETRVTEYQAGGALNWD